MRKSSNQLQYIKVVLLALGLVAFIYQVPRWTTDYSMMVVNVAIIYYFVALGLSVMLGLGGMLSFAGTSIMGVGAYFVANLSSGRHGFAINTFEALAIGVVASGVISFVLGMVLLRIKGTYFTFATIGLVQVTYAIYLNYKPLCGGPDGISSIPPINVFGFVPANYREWFYLLMVLAILVGLLIERMRVTSFGRSLASIRDNEIAANTLGVNVYMTRVYAFTVAGMLAALGGGLYAMHAQFVSSDLFTFDMSTTIVIMVMLGGVNSTPGVFVGAFLVTMMPEWFRFAERYLKLSYGIGVILLMIFMPMGLAGLANMILDIATGRKRRKKAAVVDLGTGEVEDPEEDPHPAEKEGPQ